MNLREKQILRIMAQEAEKDPQYVKLLLINDLGSEIENPVFKEFETFVDILIAMENRGSQPVIDDGDLKFISNEDLKTIIKSVFL
ncbi:hypothetical protein [Photobacterium leiognathi]|uniref:hypothetical protein n=1 Tax=Photobacterium leiognathi TaxID=553611 RepID=UPI002980AA1E|nr:hypothetical protein [Photobacterium leiognathi]